MTSTLLPQIKTFAALAEDWLAAKTREEEARAERIAVEQALLPLMPTLPEEGERSKREAGFKVVAEAGLSVSVKDKDAFALALLRGTMPASVIKTVIYDTGVLRLRRLAVKQDPLALEVYGAILPMLEIKPTKIGVTVSRYE